MRRCGCCCRCRKEKAKLTKTKTASRLYETKRAESLISTEVAARGSDISRLL